MEKSIGGVAIAFLVIVAITFWAGWLLSDDNHAVRDRQVADASVEQVLLDNMKLKTMVAESIIDGYTSSTIAAEADTRAAIAETRVVDAEARAAISSTLAADAVYKASLSANEVALAANEAASAANEAALAANEAAEAKIRAAAAEIRAATAEAKVAAGVHQQQVKGMDMPIPVTGGMNEPKSPTPTPAPQAQGVKVTGPLQWLVPGIGLLSFGLLAVITVGWRVLNNSPRTFGGRADAKDVTYVKMTREEARLYGRGRRV